MRGLRRCPTYNALLLQGYPITLTAEDVLAKHPESVRGKTALVTGGNSVRRANLEGLL